MEAKEFLKQYIKLLADIKIFEEELNELNEMALRVSPQSEVERVQSSAVQDKIGNTVARICDMTTELIERRDKALEFRKEVIDVIMQVNHKDYKLILYLRYIKGLTWEKIAVEIDKDYRWILRLHGRALQEVGKIINRP